jgi:hypothetical protein
MKVFACLLVGFWLGSVAWFAITLLRHLRRGFRHAHH